MEIIIDNKKIKVFITRKKSNKNTYIRVKEDLNIYINTNYYTNDKYIEKLIKDNINSIQNMLKKQEIKLKNKDDFLYLGKKYDIVYLNCDNIIIGDNKILINKEFDLDKWLYKEAKKIFKEELDYIYNLFPIDIPYPSLTIRKMKTRWGVCNIKLKKITLNLELIKRDKKYLDYVIAHELSHLIVSNHSKQFWLLVEKVIPNYKELRKEMREYE